MRFLQMTTFLAAGILALGYWMNSYQHQTEVLLLAQQGRSSFLAKTQEPKVEFHHTIELPKGGKQQLTTYKIISASGAYLVTFADEKVVSFFWSQDSIATSVSSDMVKDLIGDQQKLEERKGK